MEAHTLELLEFDKVRGLLAGYTASSLGRELANQLEPSTDLRTIREGLALVSEMVHALGQGHSPPFGGLHDVRLTVRRAAIGAMLNAEELLAIAETLACTGNMYRYRMRLDQRCHRLIDLLAPIEDLGPLAKSITACIDSRGYVLDAASRELAEVRRKLADLEERVQNEIKRLLRDPKIREILRYPNATVNGDHYVLPVAVNHRQKLPGLVHRTSSTGETVFIEPASIAALSAERTILKGDEEREINRVLRRLTGEVGKAARSITAALEVMARLDLITAKARYSLDYRMTEPDMNDEGKLWLRSARHPLLEHLFRLPPAPGLGPNAAPVQTQEVVPVDVRLGIGFNLLIITGPNTGGKTVTLKTTGLLALMAQSAMHIPAAEGSLVPVFTQILADIGDEQSLEQSLSTFSSHISRIAGILKVADEKSLVLLDELGAGTDPSEGAALGRAILDWLDRCRCRAIVTTHLGDLKTYAFTNERAENGAVEFDTETLRPTYRLHIGQFGMSNALTIAKRLKMPRDLLRRAHLYLRRRQKRAPEMVQLQKMKAEAEKAREEALRAQHEADRQREALRAQAEQLEREARQAQALRELRARLQPNDRVYVQRFRANGRVVRADYKRNTVTVSVGLGQWEVPFDDIFPPNPEVRS
jgi:DNA mismatch repair protein MutS2